MRARAAHRAQTVFPVVVIVNDAPSYIDAISAWQGTARFPVLYDDGTEQAARLIARFVRGFDPERIVLYRAEQTEDAPKIWPPERDGRRAALRDAWLRATQLDSQAGTWDEAITVMHARGFYPPGVVAIDTRDGAWTAGLALAAGRLCPMVFVDTPPGGIDATISPADADDLDTAIQDGLRRLRVPWRDLGDEIDAITLAINAPGRIRQGSRTGREYLATTDRIGRHAEGGSGGRWGWAGQVFGTEAEASYRAMCALFCGFENAWVFDGYPAERPWSDYDGTAAAESLRAAGLAVVSHDQPNNARDNWRLGVARGLDTDLLLINSKGLAGYFQTNPGYLRPGDVPMLDTPGAVHMVHSFSLERPANERTVGGRLLEHGVYAYIGSVNEPGLHAFVPTPILAKRLLVGMPWGVAGRIDNAHLWRLAVLGDPLMTLDAPSRRDERDFPLINGADLNELRAQAIKNKAYDQALRMLVMTGRDADAVRLGAALLASDAGTLAPEGASCAVGAAFREGRYDLVERFFERLDPPRRRDPANADPLWHSARIRMAGDPALDLTGVLATTLREGQREHDAREIADHIERLRGPAEALAYLTAVRETFTSSRARNELDKSINRLQAPRRRP